MMCYITSVISVILVGLAAALAGSLYGACLQTRVFNEGRCDTEGVAPQVWGQ